MKAQYLTFTIMSALCCVTTVYAQKNPYNEVSIASPTAGSLGKYTDIPVNYHTGIPQIDIPVYTIKSGPLSLPISFSYHASGLKVLEPAGWVGAGWALNAGGVITRTVRGGPDERGTGGFYPGYRTDGPKGYFSDYGYLNYLLIPNAGDPRSINGQSPDDADFSNGSIDAEPDIFAFNFGSYTGKFYFRDDRTPILLPEQDFNIVPTYTGSGSIQSFIVTTPDGVKYYFGKTASTTDVDPVEVTYPYDPQSGITQGTVISSWYLNKISSADDQFSINFIYQAENYSYFSLSMFPLEGSDNTHTEYKPVKEYINGVRLSQITFTNGNVTFTPGVIRQDLGDYNGFNLLDDANQQAKTLASIQISNGGTFCKKYNLFYSYFEDNTTTLPGNLSAYGNIQTDKKRLRLDSLQEISCDGTTTIPPYKFTYMTPVGNSNFAPRRLNFAMDHWGFYNGKSNASLIPTYTLNKFTRVPGANRDASWPEMSYGTLDKIIYPTGGYTQYDFEANDTWLSYPVYTAVLAASGGVGSHIGQGPTTTVTVNCTSNPYKFSVDISSTNSTFGAYASFNGAQANQTTPHGEVTEQPGPGLHSYTLAINGGTSSEWATGSVYELQTSQFNGNVIVGGLRIKTITQNDGMTTNNIVTSYTYQTNGVSNGVLYSRPTYVQVLRNDIIKQVGLNYGDPSPTYLCSPNGCIGCDAAAALIYSKSPSPLRPLSTSQGNHIGYNEVKVSQTGNGYSIYRYYGSNFWDINHDDVAYRNANINPPCNASIPNYPDPPLPYEYKRGQLKYEGHFDERGDIIKEATYYPVYQDDPVTTPGLARAELGGTDEITLYNLVSGRMTQNTVIARDYGNNITTIDSTFYESPYHHEITRKVTLTSKGERLETKYKTAFDYRISSCDAISDGASLANTGAANALSQYNTALFNCTTMGCRWMAFQQYRYDLCQARIAYVASRRSNYMDPTNAFSTCHLNAKNAAGTELKPILEMQDQYINAPVEITDWKDSKLLHADFTRWDFVSSPTGKVYPNKTQLVNLQAPSTTFTNSAVSSTTLVKDSRYLDEGTYNHAGGNLVQSLAHDGIPISYIWDYANGLPIAKIVNATSDQVAYTSFEADGNGGWTIPSGARDGTNAITGRQSYNLLNGTCTHNGLTSSAGYIVSYWSKGSSYAVTGSTGVTQGKTINGWTYFEHKVTGVTTVSVSGNGVIDEFRLYPAAAQMVTYTYTPLVGITSQCDASSKIVYYEYDSLGRLKDLKDQDGNIIKTIDYHYRGQ